MFKLFAALSVLAFSDAVLGQGPPLTVSVQPQSQFDRPPYLADGLVLTFTKTMPPFPFGGSSPGWYGTNGKSEAWVWGPPGFQFITIRAPGSCETSGIVDCGAFKMSGVHSVGGCPKGLETFQLLTLR